MAIQARVTPSDSELGQAAEEQKALYSNLQLCYCVQVSAMQ